MDTFHQKFPDYALQPHWRQRPQDFCILSSFYAVNIMEDRILGTELQHNLRLFLHMKTSSKS